MLRRPQAWRPWTPRPRYLPNTPYLTSTPCCLWTPKPGKCTQAYARQHPKVRESKRRLVCINRTPSEAEVHTKAERPASTTFTGPPETEALNRMLRSPQGWRPWTPRPRYLPNTPYLTSTPYSPLDTKGIETTFGFSIERRQRPRSTPKPRRPSTLREVPVTDRRVYINV